MQSFEPPGTGMSGFKRHKSETPNGSSNYFELWLWIY